jgi:hypothetical protein
MLALHQSAMKREGEIRRLEQTMDRQRAEEKAAGLFTRLRAKVRVSSSMEAQSTPMGWIIDTMRYGMKIRYSTPGRGLGLALERCVALLLDPPDERGHALAPLAAWIRLTSTGRPTSNQWLPTNPWEIAGESQTDTRVHHIERTVYMFC